MNAPFEPIASGRAAELRRAFDQSFAAPVKTGTHENVEFISIRLAGSAHAIRMAEIAGLFADVKITPCPSPIAELRGIAGFRGTLTPVYDLTALLGYPMSSGRWIVLANGGALAFAFDEFADHFRIEPTAIVSLQEAAATRYVGAIARHADQAFPVIDIPSVVAAIKARAATITSHKEN